MGVGVKVSSAKRLRTVVVCSAAGSLILVGALFLGSTWIQENASTVRNAEAFTSIDVLAELRTDARGVSAGSPISNQGTGLEKWTSRAEDIETPKDPTTGTGGVSQTILSFERKNVGVTPGIQTEDGAISASNRNSLFVKTSIGAMTSATAPASPTNVVITAKTQTSVSLSWAAPFNDGGRPITDYVVEFASADGSWTTFSDGVSTSTSTIVTGLNRGVSYQFRISAANDQGASAPTAGFVSSAINKVSRVDADAAHACALAANSGVVNCWGLGSSGELGNGANANSSSPVEVSGITNAIDVSSGDAHSCAALSNGLVKCWGANNAGQLGTGDNVWSWVPVTVAGISNAVAVSSGNGHSCALLADRSVKCWGWNNLYQLGSNSLSNLSNSTTPVAVYGVSSAIGISAGGTHTCALLASGSVSCWGSNTYGERGDSTTAAPNNPTVVTGISNAVSISAGGSHSCAVTDDQTLKCWGRNYDGQLGIGTVGAGVDRTTPIVVPGLTGVRSVSAGMFATCAILTPVNAKCWGYNSNGQLGNGSVNHSSSPVAVTGSARFVSFGVGTYSACAILDDQSVNCWGANESGQTGNGSTMESRIPTTTNNPRVRWVIPSAVPDVPSNFATVQKSDTSVSLAWGAPDNGGQPISNYFVEYSRDGGSWNTAKGGITNVNAALVTGLTGGVSYRFRVSAMSAEGLGQPSASLTVTPASVAATPSSLAVSSKSATTVSLSWVPPDCCLATNDYVIEFSTNGTSWSTFSDGVSDSTTTTVTGLIRGADYQFRVRAVNSQGTGSASAAVSVIPSIVPAVVNPILLSSKTVSSVSLVWGAPDDGGRALSDYVVEYSINGTSWSVFDDGISTSSSVTVTGLSLGVSYQFRVSAVSAEGTGMTSQAIRVTTTPAPVSQVSTVSKTESSVSLSWTAPLDGGQPIYDYKVEYSASGGPWSTFADGVSAAMSVTVTGLVRGNPYSFRVAAVNAEGIGPWGLFGSQISAGDDHSCAVGSDGTARCWGRNSNRQLGNGSTTTSSVPVVVSGLTGVVSISAGGSHSCALGFDGTVRCWGNNGSGQLGSDSLTSSSVPVVVSGLSGVQSISTGNAHSCAVLSDGSARCWGDNSNGQLGINSLTNSKVPVVVHGLGGVQSISAGTSRTCAVLFDGSARCWGNNSNGQLGNNSMTNSKVPVVVSGLSGAVSISTGSSHSCAVLSDGSARCWGNNSNGQLGDNSLTFSLVPVVVSGLSGAVSISTGSSHSCAVLSDGSARCWGRNSNGQLGINSLTSSSVPVVVPGLSGVQSISTGFTHSCAVESGGMVRCWGGNSYGQLGNSSSASSSVPAVTRDFERLVGVIPAVVPAAPAVPLSSGHTTTSVSLVWNPPSDDGGQAITDYQVEYSSDGSNWSTFVDGVSTSTNATVTGLTTNRSYQFRISAASAEGVGQASQSISVRTVVVPAEPRSLRVSSVSSSSVSLQWSAPFSDGGSEITDYRVAYSLDGSNWLIFPDGVSNSTDATVTGLTLGRGYQFAVSAINTAGNGPAASLSATPANAPGAPREVRWTARSSQSVSLSWLAPADDGGTPIIDYRVQYSANGSDWTVYSDGVGTSTQATVMGLTILTTYEFRVAAITERGPGLDATTAAATPILDSAQGGFSGSDPVRVFDTRPDQPDGVRPVTKAKVGGSYFIQVKLTDINIPGKNIVPAGYGQAISLNVTVTNPEGDGYVTVYPCGERPVASSLNYVAGQTIPNAVIAPVSNSGDMCFFSSQKTDLIVDVNGWFPPNHGFQSLSPRRIFDTRSSQAQGLAAIAKTKIGGTSVLRVNVSRLPGAPMPSKATAISMNVTVTNTEGPGFVTVYPCGDRPLASSLNYVAGQTIPNAVIAPISDTGEVCFYSSQRVDILADLNGWFPRGAALEAISPQRVFDTRASQPQGLRPVPKAMIGAGGVLRIRATGIPGVTPAVGIGAVSMNVTVTEPIAAGYVTVFPCGTRPTTSSLNFDAGQTIPNAVIAPVSAEGDICLFASQPTHILADITGWFHK